MHPAPMTPHRPGPAPGSPSAGLSPWGWMLRGLRRCLPGRWGGGIALRWRPRARGRLDRTREELSAFKLEVARTYVPLSLIRDVDQRLSQHLARIEQKLDAAHCAILAAAEPPHPHGQHDWRAEDRT